MIPVVIVKTVDVGASAEPIELAVILPYIPSLTVISPLIYALVIVWILFDDETVPISF